MPASTTISPPTIIGIAILGVMVLILGTALAYRIIADARSRPRNDEESLSQRSDLYSPRWSAVTSLVSNSNSSRRVEQTPSSGPTSSTNNILPQQPPMSERDRREIPAVLRPAAGPPTTQSPYQREARAQALSRAERGLHRTRPDSPPPPQIWIDVPLEPRLSIARA